MLFFLLAGCIFSKNEPEKYDGNNRDYKAIFRSCNGDSCCETSAKAVEKSQGFVLKEPSENCPEGFRTNILRCPGSFKWCEPS